MQLYFRSILIVKTVKWIYRNLYAVLITSYLDQMKLKCRNVAVYINCCILKGITVLYRYVYVAIIMRVYMYQEALKCSTFIQNLIAKELQLTVTADFLIVTSCECIHTWCLKIQINLIYNDLLATFIQFKCMDVNHICTYIIICMIHTPNSYLHI